jgi:DNA-binding NarL/FixJ family response regulator
MHRTRVLLADDHTIVADGLRSLLRDRYELVGSVGDGESLIEAAVTHRPDVIVADIAMPRLTGLGAWRRLTAMGTDARIIFLTMHADPQLAAEAIRAGASGFLLKHSAGEELISAIDEVSQGRPYVTPMIAADVITTLAGGQPRRASLTQRQVEVLRLLAKGMRMKEVAATLDLSVRTVETHKYEMMQALNVRSTAELIRFAYQNDLLEP